MKTEYVLGFAYWRNQVALIYKTKGPRNLRGHWNGIGGKVEEGETPSVAMSREYFEETGDTLNPEKWTYFGTISSEHYHMHLLCAMCDTHLDAPPHIENTEEGGEVVQWFKIKDLPNVVPNLRWIIPLSLDYTINFVEIKERN
jgi:8-oxo-dGTP diphosphatase